jgi:virulence-associated protein VagC
METEVKTKFFRNGGSVAVRIPSAWNFNPDQVTLTFDEISRSITIRQFPRHPLEEFFALQDELGSVEGDQPLFDREQGTDTFTSPIDVGSE